MNKLVQIVSFNVPYPPDYGGVIDVFYKIKVLKNLGYDIILHTYTYGRKCSDELALLCKAVYYYQRPRSIRYFFSSLPFIVRTRTSRQLCDNLQKHSCPVILEGVHSTYPLWAGLLKNHKVIVRTHNIEYLYYHGLGLTEKNLFLKYYYLKESKKLRNFEVEALQNAHHIACISPNDAAYFKQFFTNVSVVFPFHENDAVTSITGRGDYILIHADLSVPENIQSIQWLLKEVVSGIQFPVIVAGKNPSAAICKLTRNQLNVKLIANPSSVEMTELIKHAHIQLIHSFYPQGLKLKLLNSLFKGRFVVANAAVVKNTGIEHLCNIAENADDFLLAIHQLMKQPFTEDVIQLRKEGLNQFLPSKQAEKLIQLF